MKLRLVSVVKPFIARPRCRSTVARLATRRFNGAITDSQVIGVAGGSDLAAVRAVLQWSLEAHGGGAPTLQFGVASTRRSGISAID
jgi:DNA-binding transcriptional regulator LsrR (DeoR family)